jgi:tetratricopeptide (TPR) repeat protein
MSFDKCRLVTVTLVLLLFTSPPAAACSHSFDNNVFPLDDREILALPVGDFEGELRRIGFKPPASDCNRDQTDLAADVAELRAALESEGVTGNALLARVGEYRNIRVAMRSIMDRGDWPKGFTREVPEDLPEEFALYIKGALAYGTMDYDDARAAWQELLDLPPEQRRRRTVWAAYMIGRTYVGGDVEGDGTSAIEWFRRTRDLVAQGLADSQNLNRASLGWEASEELRFGNFERAIRIYFDLGDVPSLAQVAHMALAADAVVLDRLARDPLASGVITACAVAGGGPWRHSFNPNAVQRWLESVERAGAQNLDGADRLAWAAYQNGLIDPARRWLARAKADAPMALWLRSKFLLREGRIDESAEVLARLIKSWPANEELNSNTGRPTSAPALMTGELGMLKLQRGQYAAAADLLLRAGYFREAAYVAERVMTADELKAYVDANWSGDLTGLSIVVPDGGDNPYGTRMSQAQVSSAIRYLLARRLTRLGRWREADAYYPPGVQPRFAEYIAAIRAGADPALSKDERGESLWTAAQIARKSGMELMGTELEPDFFCYDGQFGTYGRDPTPPRGKPQPDNPITAPDDEERRRVRAHHPTPDHRFHYRYIAADHAWAAAQLLPDESDLKALVLCTAGNWLNRDETDRAVRFYKSLAYDCGTTKLGREARRIRWLPYR